MDHCRRRLNNPICQPVFMRVPSPLGIERKVARAKNEARPARFFFGNSSAPN